MIFIFQLDSGDKKISRKEKDERILWKKNEVGVNLFQLTITDFVKLLRLLSMNLPHSPSFTTTLSSLLLSSLPHSTF